MEFEQRFRSYYITAIFSILISLASFAYNTWRLEVSEKNSTIRTASFELIKNLSELEQLLYALHYDKDIKEGSPRKAWIKVGLIKELSPLVDVHVKKASDNLHDIYSENWSHVKEDENATLIIVDAIDKIRDEIKEKLKSLE